MSLSAVPPPRAAAARHRRLLRSAHNLGRVTSLALAAGACRCESIVAPSQALPPVCETTDCSLSGAPAPSAPIVIGPLEDAVTRIVPSLMNTRARAELPGVLNALRGELLAGRLDQARIQLARSYDALGRASGGAIGSVDPSLALDLADLSAIRLALVPAATALGVGAP